MKRRLSSFLILAAGSLALSACGGGGGGGGSVVAPPPSAPVVAPSAPVVSLTFATKRLDFKWLAVPGATSYRLLRNPDGGATFVEARDPLPADATTTSLEVSVHLVDWLNARYRIQACNSAGCTPSADVAAVTGFESTTGYVKASNTASDDRFGQAVAMSRDGNTLAVGSYLDDGPGDATADAGAVYVYNRDASGTWSQRAYLTASNADADDYFGRTLDISADGATLLVGAQAEDSFATGVNGNSLDNTVSAAGAAYVFVRTNAGWTQQAYLKAFNTEAYDSFGRDVTLSDDGSLAVIGALGEDGSADGINGLPNNLAANAGAAYVFARTGTDWVQEAYIKSSRSGSNQYFGTQVAIDSDGTRLVVSAPGEGSGATGVDGPQNSNTHPNSGAAYVFVRTGGVWAQEAYLKASRAHVDLEFGSRLAISGSGGTIAIGAMLEDGGSTGANGNQDLLTQEDSGAVYVFQRSGTEWTQQAYLKAANTGAEDYFGSALALNSNGSQLAIGAQGEDSFTAGINGNALDNSGIEVGAAYVFVRTNGAWAQQSYLKPLHPENVLQSGLALDMSGAGTTLAVGMFDSSAATGVGGNPLDASMPLAGAVLLY
ncbi:MAG: integrin [Pseudomonadota bacterium]